MEPVSAGRLGGVIIGELCELEIKRLLERDVSAPVDERLHPPQARPRQWAQSLEDTFDSRIERFRPDHLGGHAIFRDLSPLEPSPGQQEVPRPLITQLADSTWRRARPRNPAAAHVVVRDA